MNKLVTSELARGIIRSSAKTGTANVVAHQMPEGSSREYAITAVGTFADKIPGTKAVYICVGVNRDQLVHLRAEIDALLAVT